MGGRWFDASQGYEDGEAAAPAAPSPGKRTLTSRLAATPPGAAELATLIQLVTELGPQGALAALRAARAQASGPAEGPAAPANAGGTPHAERVNFGQDKPDFVGRTAPVTVTEGQVLAFLARAMDLAYFNRVMPMQPAAIRVCREDGTAVAVVEATKEMLPRRFEVARLPPGRYCLEIAGRLQPELPPALLQVRAWAEAAGGLASDADMAAQTSVRRVDGAELETVVAACTSERVTLGKEANLGVNVSVAVGAGQELVALVRLVPRESALVHYLSWRARAPEQVNLTCLVRVVDGRGRAVAHLSLDPTTQLPAEIAVRNCPPGDYRLVMVGMPDKTRASVPLQGFAGARPATASAPPAVG
jgi:hypothetical protein